MVAFSKSKRAVIVLPVLCFAFLSMSSLTQAQTFANVKYENARTHANNMMDDDEESSGRKSHVDQLDGSSSIFDMVAAH